MTATRVAAAMDDLALVLADAPLPVDPFESADVMAAAKHLGAELVGYMARTRAHRVAHAADWATHSASVRAGFDPEGHPPPPPPPPPPPDEDPPPQPQPDPGGDQ